MPITGQIIPKYQVPHIETYINDNSSYETAAATTATELGVRFLCVFASERGEDGVIKTITNTSDFIKEYGTPNFAKYGQANLMPYVALATNNAACHCLRVAPSDATHSTLVVYAKPSAYVGEVTETKTSDGTTALVLTNAMDSVTSVSVTASSVTTTLESTAYSYSSTTKTVTFTTAPTNGATVKVTGQATISGKVSGKFTTKQIPASDSLTVEDITTYFSELEKNDTDGYPLFVVYSKGKGAYGNDFSVKVAIDSATNKDQGNLFMNHTLQVIDKYSGTSIVSESFDGSFDESSVINNKSLFFNDSINDDESGSSCIGIIVNSGNIEDYITACNGVIGTGSSYTIKNLDIFGSTDKYVSDSLFGSATGIQLAGGVNGTETEESLNNLYISAFKDDTNIGIRSKRRSPAEYILDAGYAVNVKKALINCGTYRKDARIVVDMGNTEHTIDEIKTTVYESIFGSDVTDDNYLISKECQTYKTRDPFTNKIIRVTSTYFLAGNLPTHVFNNGNHIPFVGGQYAPLTGHIKRSIAPFIDADDYEKKEELYNMHFNFFECIGEDSYARATQSTSQSKVTDLSEESNVDVLLEMKRTIENFLVNRLYSFTDAEDRVKFTEDAQRLFATYINNKVSEFDVYFNMNEFEKNKSILHCYLSVTFKGVGKRGIIEIDINKRS